MCTTNVITPASPFFLGGFQKIKKKIQNLSLKSVKSSRDMPSKTKASTELSNGKTKKQKTSHREHRVDDVRVFGTSTRVRTHTHT